LWNSFDPKLASQIKQSRSTILMEWRGLFAG